MQKHLEKVTKYNYTFSDSWLNENDENYIAGRLIEEIGYKGSFTHDLTKPVGMRRKLVDITLLSEFGWKYQFELRDGIKETYKYYLENVYK